jgi:ABC-type antimicrobial peptide transport system permease subunit
MSRSPKTQQRPWRRFFALVIPTLAYWQVRRAWFLLLFISLGLIAAVVVTTSIPLYADVTMTAGLRGLLRGTPDDAEIKLYMQGSGISSTLVQDAEGQFTPLLSQYLGKTVKPEQSFTTSEDFFLSPFRPDATLLVYGTPIQQAAFHLDLLQGRFASAAGSTANGFEVMLTPDTAKQLGVHVGSTVQLVLQYGVDVPGTGVDEPPQQYTSKVFVHVVGLFTVPPADAAYWHGEDFKTVTIDGRPPYSEYTLLVPDDALLTLYDHLSTLHHVKATRAAGLNQYSFTWDYRLDSSQLTINDLASLINQLAGLQATVNTLYSYENTNSSGSGTAPEYPYVTAFRLSSPLFSSDNGPSILEEFQSRVDVAQIPTGVFAILTFSLILFFVSLMTTSLIEHQANTIALLRSRGASSRQVFGATMLQSIALGLIALVIGLPLAFGVVLLLAQHVLSVTEQDALSIITSNPLQAVLGTVWYALAIVLVVLITLSLSLLFAIRANILSQRREAARSNKPPLWQRLNLDVIAGIIALVGYGFSLYVTSVGTVLQSDANALIVTPLSIIAPFFLIVGGLLLFLRIFPWLLRLGAHLAGRGRGAISLLVFTQIARAPRKSLRMVLLLALAIAFAFFTLTTNATEAAHIQEIVTYQAGADFSGDISASPGILPSRVIKQYQAIPGVLSASAGFVGQGYGGTANLPMDVRAIDAASFGDSVKWPSQASSQAELPLLSHLVALRKLVATGDIIPAIVDQTTLTRLLLHVGSFFTVTLNTIYPAQMNCLIVGVIDQIPTVNTLIPGTNGQAPSLGGGIVVDYQTYVNAFTQDTKKLNKIFGPPVPPTINRVWLRTKGDAVSLASVRTALKSPKYYLAHLIDQRLLLVTLQSDPLYLMVNGILGIGMVTALLLALVGTLLTSWVSARSRVMGFVTLRALGTSPRQVTSIVIWEQTIVYISGFLLGGGFGVLLTRTVTPALTFTDLNLNLSNQQLFALQSVLAAKIVVPPSLPLLLLAVVIIFAIALTSMVRVVSQPALSQTLRLNED